MQIIMLTLFKSEPRPDQTGPSPTVVDDPVDYSAPEAAASASAAVIADLTSGGSKRDVIELQSIEKRTNGDCSKQPDGYGPKPSVDSVDAFLALQTLHASSLSVLSSLFLIPSRTLQTTRLPLKVTPRHSKTLAHRLTPTPILVSTP